MTTKQVARYWDNGWIEGTFRTPKGHRRVRYVENAVERVATKLAHAKRTNIAIRYHIPSTEYDGIQISFHSCTNFQDAVRRAKAAGLSKAEAWNLIESFGAEDSNPPSSDSHLAWSLLLASCEISERELAKSMKILQMVPVADLAQARDAQAFQAKAQTLWKRIARAYGGARTEQVPRGDSFDADGAPLIFMLRSLLHQPDVDSFLKKYGEVVEIRRRPVSDDEGNATVVPVPSANSERPKMGAGRDSTLGNLEDGASKNLLAAELQTAVRALERSGQKPLPASLAKILGVSRSALYRRFKAHGIRAALRSIQGDCPKPERIASGRKTVFDIQDEGDAKFRKAS